MRLETEWRETGGSKYFNDVAVVVVVVAGEDTSTPCPRRWLSCRRRRKMAISRRLAMEAGRARR